MIRRKTELNIVDFDRCHVAAALDMATMNLNRQSALTDLPARAVGELSWLTKGIGVAAVEDDRLAGYLVAFGPFTGMFGTSGMPFEHEFVGVFSPVQAHGAAENATPRLWQRMYQAAAEKWARAGAVYHALTLWNGDQTAREAMFRYGFGQRCADAIRPCEPLDAPCVPGISCAELPTGSAEAIRHLRRGLDEHLCQSPCFMARTPEGREAWLDSVKHRESRLFAAMDRGRPVAFIEVTADGENFLTEAPDMLNICGAFCEAAWRGTGASRMLLDHVLRVLQAEGVRRLGVDYETMNPTAAGFWEKYFTPYTASLVRRIDKA